MSEPDAEFVRVALRALLAFGINLDRAEAAKLLSMWRYAIDLSDADREAILASFPDTDRYDRDDVPDPRPEPPSTGYPLGGRNGNGG